MKRILRLILCITALAVFLQSTPASADYRQFGNVFLSSDGLCGSLTTARGIYFFYSEKKILPQLLDVSKITDGVAVFLEFDPNLNRYIKLYSADKTYDVVGSFTIYLKNMVVNVNNIYAYTTMEYSEGNSEPYFVGFKANQHVLSNRGIAAVELLSAKNNLKKHKDIIPYIVNQSGEIKFKDETSESVSSKIGVDFQSPYQNKCLEKNTIILPEKGFKELAGIKDYVQKKRNLEFMIKNQKIAVKDLIPLDGDQKRLIFLNPLTNDLYHIKEQIDDKNTVAICTFQVLDLS